MNLHRLKELEVPIEKPDLMLEVLKSCQKHLTTVIENFEGVGKARYVNYEVLYKDLDKVW